MVEIERARTAHGRKMDEMADEDGYSPVFIDPWDRPCSVGRWSELLACRHEEMVSWRRAAEVPDGDDWWRVGSDTVGETWVSTVWIGYSWSGEAWETMIFDPPEWFPAHGEAMIRSSTRVEAEVAHRLAVNLVQPVDTT